MRGAATMPCSWDTTPNGQPSRQQATPSAATRPHHTRPPTTPAEHQRLLMAGTWLNTSMADDLFAMLARDPADIVVIDCMLAGVLAGRLFR